MPVRSADHDIEHDFSGGIEGNTIIEHTHNLRPKWQVLGQVGQTLYRAAANEQSEQGPHLTLEMTMHLSVGGVPSLRLASMHPRHGHWRACERCSVVFRRSLVMVYSHVAQAYTIMMLPSSMNISSRIGHRRHHATSIAVHSAMILFLSNIIATCFFHSRKTPHGGVGCTSVLVGYLGNITIKMYVCTREWKSELPYLVGIFMWGTFFVRQHAFCGRLIGAGKLAFMSKDMWKPEVAVPRYPRAKLEFIIGRVDAGAKPTMFPITTQTFFRCLLIIAAGFGDPTGVTCVGMMRSDFHREDHIEQFQIRFGEVHSDARISCAARAHVRSKKISGGDDIPCWLWHAGKRLE